MLRYWEQEFTQLKPVKRRGNRHYYQHHGVPADPQRFACCMKGFTITGARHRLESEEPHNGDHVVAGVAIAEPVMPVAVPTNQSLRAELQSILAICAHKAGFLQNFRLKGWRSRKYWYNAPLVGA